MCSRRLCPPYMYLWIWNGHVCTRFVIICLIKPQRRESDRLEASPYRSDVKKKWDHLSIDAFTTFDECSKLLQYTRSMYAYAFESFDFLKPC